MTGLTDGTNVAFKEHEPTAPTPQIGPHKNNNTKQSKEKGPHGSTFGDEFLKTWHGDGGMQEQLDNLWKTAEKAGIDRPFVSRLIDAATEGKDRDGLITAIGKKKEALGNWIGGKAVGAARAVMLPAANTAHALNPAEVMGKKAADTSEMVASSMPKPKGEAVSTPNMEIPTLRR